MPTTLRNLDPVAVEDQMEGLSLSDITDPTGDARNGSDDKDVVANANKQLCQMICEVNTLINKKLRLSELHHTVSHLSDIKAMYEKALKNFEKAACFRRDEIVRHIQYAQSNPEAFKKKVWKESMRGAQEPVPPPRIPARIPSTKSIKKRIRLENVWRRKYEIYHRRYHWSLSGARAHISRLEVVRKELLSKENIIARRTRIAEEGVVLMNETIENLKAKLASPPHHIYEDAWNVLTVFWVRARRQLADELKIPLEATDVTSYPTSMFIKDDAVNPLISATEVAALRGSSTVARPVHIPITLGIKSLDLKVPASRMARISSYRSIEGADNTRTHTMPGDSERDVCNDIQSMGEGRNVYPSIQNSATSSLTSYPRFGIDNLGSSGHFFPNQSVVGPLQVVNPTPPLLSAEYDSDQSQYSEHSPQSVEEPETPTTSPELDRHSDQIQSAMSAKLSKSVVFADQVRK